MKNKNGEIGTFIMLAVLVVVSIVGLGSSTFLAKKQTVSTKAAAGDECNAGNEYQCNPWPGYGVSGAEYCGGALGCGMVGWGPADVCYRCVGPNCSRTSGVTVQYPANSATDQLPCCIEKPNSSRLCCGSIDPTIVDQIVEHLINNPSQVDLFTQKATNYQLSCLNKILEGIENGGAADPSPTIDVEIAPAPECEEVTCPQGFTGSYSKKPTTFGTIQYYTTTICSGTFYTFEDRIRHDVCVPEVVSGPTLTPTPRPGSPTATPTTKPPTPTIPIDPRSLPVTTAGECIKIACEPPNSPVLYSGRCLNPFTRNSQVSCGGEWEYYLNDNCNSDDILDYPLNNVQLIYCLYTEREITVHVDFIIDGGVLNYSPSDPILHYIIRNTSSRETLYSKDINLGTDSFDDVDVTFTSSNRLEHLLYYTNNRGTTVSFSWALNPGNNSLTIR